MAKVITTELQRDGASGPNITLDTSKNVTCENNLQVDGNVTVTGTIPADKLTGTAAAINGSNITNLPAANLTGALPAISGASLTGITTRTQPFRNLVVNGGCRVAQRATTQATHTGHGYFTVDRFYTSIGGENEGREEAQITLTASDTGPWEKGFRNAFQVTNGNQTSTDAGDYLWAMVYYIEAQDIANSHWNHKDPNSKLTISFWVKSSVAQNFYGYFRTSDGTSKYRPFETGALSANTWTKITKTIPGHADCQIDNNNGQGLEIKFYGYAGTDYTTSSVSLDTWYTWPNGSETTPDWPASMDDWWRTNNATLAFTGLQVEAGDTATEFEHRSYVDEFQRCMRYYWKAGHDIGGDYPMGLGNTFWSGTRHSIGFITPVPMRSTPSISDTGDSCRVYGQGTYKDVTSYSDIGISGPYVRFVAHSADLGDDNHACHLSNRSSSGIVMSAEL